MNANFEELLVLSAEIKLLLSKSKLHEVVRKLVYLSQQFGDTELANNAIMISSKFHNLINDKIADITDKESSRLERNKLSSSILSMLNLIEEELIGKLSTGIVPDENLENKEYS